MFFFKAKKNINVETKQQENADVLEMIDTLKEYKMLLHENISWWYNCADEESLKRQLGYYTGQLRRMEKWVDSFNELLSVLQENIYIDDINNIRYGGSVFISLKRNKELIKWCINNNKYIDDDFKKYSLVHDMFCGDRGVADLMLSKEHWNHSDKWQNKWMLEVNYYGWCNEKYAMENNGTMLVDYRRNKINSLHTEAIIYDCLKYSGAKLNQTNAIKFMNTASQTKDLKNAKVVIKNELGKYNVLLDDKVITGYVKESTSLKLKDEIELMIKYLRGEC